MAWDDSPPTDAELRSAGASASAPSWDSAPPSADEISKLGITQKAPTESDASEKPLTPAEQRDAHDDAVADSFFDTLTMGHLPQIKAKAKQIVAGEGLSNDQNYVNRRDQEVAALKAEMENHPFANAEGKILGFGVPMLASFGSAAPAEGVEAIEGAAPAVKSGISTAAKYLGAGAKSAAVGAGMGFAQNPGDTPGVVDPLQIQARASNAKTGAMIGAPLGIAANAVPDAIAAINDYAEKKAVKAGGAMLKDFRNLNGKDAVNETGRFILDNGLVQAGDNFDSVAQKAAALRDQTGQQLGAGYETAQKLIPRLDPKTEAMINESGFNPVRDKQAILDAAKSDLGYSFRRKGALQGLSDYLDELAEEHGDQTLNPATTNQIKTALDKSAIDWARNPMAREPDAEAALKTLRGFLSDKVSGQVKAIGSAIGDDAAAEKLAALNKQYGMASQVANMAQDRASRDAANAAFGLKEYAGAEIGGRIGGAVAGKPGELIGTGVGLAGGHILRGMGSSTAAAAANRIGQGLERLPIPEALSAANPAPYQAIGGDLPSKSSPIESAPWLAPAKTTVKGPDKWANDGFQNLLDHATDNDKETIQNAKEKLLASPQAKKLLISASDLKPGTKGMQSILEQIKQNIGGAQ